MRPPKYVPVEADGLDESAILTPMQTGMHGMRNSSDDEEAILAELAAKGNLDYVIPQLARDHCAMQRIESVVRGLRTNHTLILGDARTASALEDESIHLVVTSHPYWTLKRYNEVRISSDVAECDEFIAGLNKVWKHCCDAVVRGGRVNTNADQPASGCRAKERLQ